MNKDNPLKIAVLASGRGSNFEALVSAIAENSWNMEISLLLSDRPDSGAIALAKSYNIVHKVVQKGKSSSREFSENLAEAVSTTAPDLIVLAGFMRVLDKHFIASFPHKIINIHPSLLPAFKGLKAQSQALEAGVHFTGCTVHIVNEELDSGSILGQTVVPILPLDKLSDLEERILQQEHILLPQVIHKLATRQIEISNKGEVDFRDSRLEDSETNIMSLMTK